MLKLSILSLLSAENIFLIGPPGTAKSMIARRLVKALSDSENIKYFEYLMNEFSTPDEICGPVSLKMLQNDKYIRLIDGYLPSANVAFLDEIWKSGPAILNTLLTLINEKIFHNGNEVIHTQLLSLIGASNELPSANTGLDALWDRFIVRVRVDNVNDDDFFNVVESALSFDTIDSKIDESVLFSIEEIEELKQKCQKIELGDSCKRIIMHIRNALNILNQDENISDGEKYYVSDRRWKKIVHLIKMSALLNDRKVCEDTDCYLIRYCIWNTNEQYFQAERIVAEALNAPNPSSLDELKIISEKIENFKNEIDKNLYEEKEVFVEEKINNKPYYKCTFDEEIIYFPIFDEDESYYGIGIGYETLDAAKLHSNTYYYPEKNGDTIKANISNDKFRYPNNNSGAVEFKIEKRMQKVRKNLANNTKRIVYDKLKSQYDAIHLFIEDKMMDKVKKDSLDKKKNLVNENIFITSSQSHLLSSDFQKSEDALLDMLCQLEKLESKYL